MEYNGEVIDYSSSGFSRFGVARQDCKVYEIYPSEAGIDPDKLLKAMKERKENVKGSDYQYFGNNCARQVIACLEAAGAKDIPQPLGIAVPSIPFFDDLEDWAKEHGYLASKNQSSTEQGDLYTKYKYAIEILCNRQQFKEEMEEDLKHPNRNTMLADVLAKQSEEALAALGYSKEKSDKPSEVDYQIYARKRMMLLFSDEQLMNFVISSYRSLVDPRVDYAIKHGITGEIKNVGAMDFETRVRMVKFAQEHVDQMPRAVMERLKKEGIVTGYGDSILEKKHKKTNPLNRACMPDRQIT